MDGSASTSLAERTRMQISRAFVNRTANEANAQSELFEQLLNLSFTVPPPPEKQPVPYDTGSSTVDDSSLGNDDQDVAPVEEDKDDKPTETVAALVQTVPLIAEKPVEHASDQPLAVTQVDTGALTAADAGSTKVNEKFTATSETGTGDQVSAIVDEQVVVAETLVVDSTVESKSIVADSSFDDSTSALRTQDGDSRSKKTAPTVTTIDAPKADQSPERSNGSETEPNEVTVAKAQREIAIEPKAANSQQSDSHDRRGERREKWFERNGENIAVSSADPQNDLLSDAAREKVDLATVETNSASSQASTPAAISTSEPLAIAPTAAPAALPAALSVVPQNGVNAATPIPTATSTSSTESTSAISAAPSRSVGNQTAKSSSQEKATEPSLSQQERVRVIQRIARSFNRISSEGGSINLRLHPEHLGSVNVQVRLEGRSLSARLSTETAAARDAIMQDLPALRQRLADQGFDVTKFQVDVAGNGADASFAQSNGQSQFGQSENRPSGTHTDYRRIAANREARSATTRHLSPATNLTWQSGAGIDLQA